MNTSVDTTQTQSPPARYRGRFAPSPTGPLHLGSLVTALASCLDARAHGGAWLLRIDDVDRQRARSDAAEAILQTLDAFGFCWDETPVWQSRRRQRHAEVFAQLRDSGVLYPCACTRRALADAPRAGDGAAIYPGTCRRHPPARTGALAWRLPVPEQTVLFHDRIGGSRPVDLRQSVGDVLLRRADGEFAYQLVAVVDDADSGISDVVRGADLFYSSVRQTVVHASLGLPLPRYAHVPVVRNAAGEKLSKQTLAPPLDVTRPGPALLAALRHLGQMPPHDLARAPVARIWRWALEHWDISRVDTPVLAQPEANHAHS